MEDSVLVHRLNCFLHGFSLVYQRNECILLSDAPRSRCDNLAEGEGFGQAFGRTTAAIRARFGSFPDFPAPVLNNAADFDHSVVDGLFRTIVSFTLPSVP